MNGCQVAHTVQLETLSQPVPQEAWQRGEGEMEVWEEQWKEDDSQVRA